MDAASICKHQQLTVSAPTFSLSIGIDIISTEAAECYSFLGSFTTTLGTVRCRKEGLMNRATSELGHFYTTVAFFLVQQGSIDQRWRNRAMTGSSA